MLGWGGTIFNVERWGDRTVPQSNRNDHFLDSFWTWCNWKMQYFDYFKNFQLRFRGLLRGGVISMTSWCPFPSSLLLHGVLIVAPRGLVSFPGRQILTFCHIPLCLIQTQKAPSDAPRFSTKSNVMANGFLVGRLCTSHTGANGYVVRLYETSRSVTKQHHSSTTWDETVLRGYVQSVHTHVYIQRSRKKARAT